MYSQYSVVQVMKSSLLKKYSVWEFLLVFAFLFAMPMRVYVPTSFVIEGVTILLIIFVPKRSGANRIAGNSDYLHIGFLLFLLLLGIILGTTSPPFFNENYRYFTFFLFLTVLKSRNVNYRNLLQLCFWACVLCSAFSIYELVYLNLLNFGDYNGIPILGPASAAMYVDKDSDYLMQQWFLGIPFFRPMGFFIQPQKSGFIPVLGTICYYLLYRDANKGTKFFWYSFFTLIVIASAAKTAIVSQLIIFAVAVLNLYPRKNLRPKDIIIMGVISIPLLVYVVMKIFRESHSEETMYILNDIIAFFNFPVYNWFMGVGIPSDTDLFRHGFVCECYIARLLAQVGIIFFIFELIWGYKLIKSKSTKINWVIIGLLFGLFSHYCILNAYFMTFVLSVIVCYTRSVNKKELE